MNSYTLLKAEFEEVLFIRPMKKNGSEIPIVLGKLSDRAVSEQILEQLQRSQKPRVQQASQVMKCLFRQRVITNGN